jgi:N-acetylneuraminic acid mutarotase
VRRRRTIAALVVVAASVAAFVVTSPGSSKHSSVGVSSPRAPAKHRTPRLEVSDAAWLLPAPVSRAVAVGQGSSVLILGGLDANQASSTGVFRLDPRRGTLTPAGSLALPTHDAAGATINGVPFTFGGGAQTTVDAVQSVPASGPGSVVGHLPHPRSDLAALKIGATVYLVGGYDGAHAALDVLATTDGVRFRVAARLAKGVRYPAVAALGDVIYVFGGEWANSMSDAVQAIDVRTGHVRVVGHLPEPRTQAAVFTIGGSVFVAGGRTPSGLS